MSIIMEVTSIVVLITLSLSKNPYMHSSCRMRLLKYLNADKFPTTCV